MSFATGDNVRYYSRRTVCLVLQAANEGVTWKSKYVTYLMFYAEPSSTVISGPTQRKATGGNTSMLHCGHPVPVYGSPLGKRCEPVWPSGKAVGW